MHDVIREMAIWVASEHGKKRNKVLVQEGLEPYQLGEFKKWKDAEMISLWGAATSLTGCFRKISCSHLSTLILKQTRLKTIPGAVFPSMPSLKVLDMSYNPLLVKLPDNIGQLINLQYLNLSNTSIHRMPIEVNCLIKLVFLILPPCCRCSAEVVSSLSSLRVFSWFDDGLERILALLDSGIYLGPEMKALLDRGNYIGPEMNEALLNGANNVLEVLLAQGVEDLSLGLSSAQLVEKLLTCPELLSSLRSLFVESCKGLTSFQVSTTSLRSMEHLQFLWLHKLYDLREIGIDHGGPRCAPTSSRTTTVHNNCFRSLTTVCIHEISGLRDLTSLIHHAPFLEMLEISVCESLREIISSDKEEGCMSGAYFSCLTHLRLYDLPQLRNICRRALSLDSLQVIKVCGCPELKKLPLACDSAKNSLRKIQGPGQWWKQVQWDDPAAQQVFSSKFVERGAVNPLKVDMENLQEEISKKLAELESLELKYANA